MAFSFNVFQEPYHFAPGGVTGLSILFNQFFNCDDGLFILGVNIILIGVSYIFLGKDLTRNTIFGSLVFPLFVSLTKGFRGLVLDVDPLIVCIFGGLLSGLGLGLVYKNGFTSGGTDIINQIMESIFHVPLSVSLLLVDGSIVLMSLFVFGPLPMIYSFILLLVISMVSNKVFLDLDSGKVLYILTSKPLVIKRFLNDDYAYDLSSFDVLGGYSFKKMKLYMCLVSKRDYSVIKEGIKYLDPDAFIVVTNCYEDFNANVMLRGD